MFSHQQIFSPRCFFMDCDWCHWSTEGKV